MSFCSFSTSSRLSSTVVTHLLFGSRELANVTSMATTATSFSTSFLINELPISSYCILSIADKNNNAVLAEINNSTKMYKRISMTSDDSYVCSTNHYTLEGMQGFAKNKMVHSVERINAFRRNLDKKELIDKSELKGILSRHIPDGLACHYYEEGLGTLWSILYDITQVKAEICFGSPVSNKWYSFDFSCDPGVTEYKASLPFEKADPRMWMRI
jgi:hypothetical protein